MMKTWENLGSYSRVLVGLLLPVGALPIAAGPEPLRVNSIGLVAPQVLAVEFTVGEVQERPLRPYVSDITDTFLTAGKVVGERLWASAHLANWADRLPKHPEGIGSFVFARRDGQPLGWIVGPKRDHLWPIQPLDQGVWDGASIADPQNYTLRSVDREGREADWGMPQAVFHKIRPHHKGATGPGYEGPLGRQVTLYLVYGRDIRSGKSYRLESRGGQLPEMIELDFNDELTTTPALHVNLAGYESAAPAKLAFYSIWMGDGGGISLAKGATFQVINRSSGAVVLERAAQRRTGADGVEWRDEAGRDYAHAGAPVWQMDFSSITAEGSYVVRLPGVGVSTEFEIRGGVWEDALRLQMKGFLHQRSGLELGRPFTEYRRPRNLHPADGQPILSCDEEAFWALDLGAGMTEANPFDRIEVSVIPGSQNLNAWGSWADAADHDRRYRHLEAVHVMLQLWETNPGYFSLLRLALPDSETANHMPDLLDEALWGIDLYRRTQRPDGAIIYGIESLAHPNRGEPSWLETLPVAVVPPTPDASYTYAGAAARLARALQEFDAPKATAYADSARRAYAWALTADQDPRYPTRYQARAENRLMAAWQLWRLAEEDCYFEVFKDELQAARLVWSNPVAELPPLFENVLPLIDFALADSVPTGWDKEQAWWRNRLVVTADMLTAGAKESGFALLRRPGRDYYFWIVEAEGGAVLIAAHLLSGKSDYLEVLLAATHFAMGANPLNLAYTSGLGSHSIRPMVGDAEFAQWGFPDGIPAYGPVVIPVEGLPKKAWAWDQRRAASLRPCLFPEDLASWPLYETYFQSIALPAINEFTLHQGMSDQALRWGYLAQFYSR